MINLELVSYKQSKILKNLGFPQEYISSSQKIYNTIGELTTRDTTFFSYGFESVAPSLELVKKWLRDEKNIHIEISVYDIETNYELIYKFTIFTLNTNVDIRDAYTEFYSETMPYSKSYEEALSLGIDKALELLLNNLLWKN